VEQLWSLVQTSICVCDPTFMPCHQSCPQPLQERSPSSTAALIIPCLVFCHHSLLHGIASLLFLKQHFILHHFHAQDCTGVHCSIKFTSLPKDQWPLKFDFNCLTAFISSSSLQRRYYQSLLYDGSWAKHWVQM
jgi:hypothetical protein